VAHSKKTWAKALGDYTGGKGSLDEIAERYGINPGHLRRRAAREKWTEKRDAIAAEAQRRAADRTADDLAEVLRGHAARARAGLDLFDLMAEEMASKAKKRSPYALEKLMTSLREAIRIERLAIGVEPEKPVTPAQEAQGTTLVVKRKRNDAVPAPDAQPGPAVKPAKVA
jgi:replicative superfamily II helicase